MDEILIRFPIRGEDIFKQLDDKTLANCKNVSKVWYNFLDNGSLLWKRRIWKFTQNQVEFNNHWKLVTNKAPIDMLRNLATAVEEYFTLYPKELDDQFSPLRIAGSMGIISLCDHIIERTGVINPARKKDGLTPLHTAAAVVLTRPSLCSKSAIFREAWHIVNLHRAGRTYKDTRTGPDQVLR